MKRSATLTEPELTQICILPRFDNSDIRETASRWRKPTPRQQWVLDHDSLQLVNTADQQRRGMPPYLLIVDLVFAAVGANCAHILKEFVDEATRSPFLWLSQGAPHFFMLFLSVSWPWVVVNARLNAYDAEDISFEAFVMVLMAGMLSVAFHLGPCFFKDDGLDDGVPSVWLDEANHCFDFMLSFASVRALLQLLGLYIAYHVPEARGSILRREARTLLAWAPLTIAFLALAARDAPPTAPATLGRTNLGVSGMLFATTALDALLTSGQTFLGDGGENCHLCSGAGNVVPMSIKYYEARYERMMVIWIGYVVSQVVLEMASETVHATLQQQPADRLAIFVGVPWVAFVVKVFYFDLSPKGTSLMLRNAASCSTDAPPPQPEVHAMYAGKRRGVAWTLLHLPLFGAVSWISVALAALIDEEEWRWHANGTYPDGEGAGARGDAAPENFDRIDDINAFSFCGALVSYLLCVSAVQVLHSGAGRKRRRIGRTRRLLMRGVLCGLLMLLTWLWTEVGTFDGWSITSFFALMTALVTLQAAIELWGRGFSLAPNAREGISATSPEIGSAPASWRTRP